MDEAVQEVLLLLGYGLGDEAGQRLQAARHGVQLVLQRADALVQLLAALLQLRHQVVHHILGLAEQRRQEIRDVNNTAVYGRLRHTLTPSRGLSGAPGGSRAECNRLPAGPE